MAALETAGAIAALNDLIVACKDGADTFRSAAEGAGTELLNAQFNAYAKQRELFAAELQAEVRRLGGDPAESGSLSGAIDRGWVQVRPAVTGRDNTTALEECLRTEEATLESYARALETDLSPEVRAILERQRWAIEESRSQLQTLKQGRFHVTPGAGRRKPTRTRVARGRVQAARKGVGRMRGPRRKAAR